MEKVPSQTSSDPEKPGNDSSELSSLSDTTPLDPAVGRVIWRKIDLWILPVVSMFYFLSFLDRSNIGNARVAGLQKDLNMTNREYSIALTVTYVPYIVAELPSNLLLKVRPLRSLAVGPNLMLPTMLTLWGVVTTLQGAVTSYAGLLACRFFLGLFEGGVLPGLVLYLSFFYPRQQLQWRVSLFFSTASISGAFSGLMAYGIIHMEGVGHRPGWAWIFILEGLFTMIFGLCTYFLLPRTPAHAHFLNEAEKAYVVAKLRETGATSNDDASDEFSWSEVWQAFTLPQVWMVSVIFFFNGVILYGLAYFTPSIVQSLGYSATRTQLMSVPPFATAFFVNLVAAYISDHYHCRGFVTMFSCTLCIIGFAMYLASSSPSVKYGSLFLSIPGTYCSAPALSTWGANNAAPHARRATAIAIGFIVSNSGGILATWLLGTLSPPPLYRKATLTLLIMSVFMVAVTAMNTYYLWVQNKKKAAIRATMDRSKESPDLGDKSAWFIYNL
ncbi:major facilitator superfamily domain-containing protein [Collybia nuda]|uniref:Major facilitator superfamily domain-containing protein n=1 Tax=Collybia nuda TaxID=64659 RepID=A0A9P5Y251_9AGAR|nr:major facilitator superfamily domain-containing protein [Collybia nuda]